MELFCDILNIQRNLSSVVLRDRTVYDMRWMELLII